MRTDELDYDLDPSLIATHPAEPRDAARLMVVDRKRDRVDHRYVRDLPEFLEGGDGLVVNTTRVIPARVTLLRAKTGGQFEGLLTCTEDPAVVSAYVKGAKRLHDGDQLDLCDRDGAVVGSFEVQPRRDERVVLRVLGHGDVYRMLQDAGRAPLPPYILSARRDRGEPSNEDVDQQDLDWYQTVYAEAGDFGSVAAPTAGLHFTPSLLNEIKRIGVQRIDVDLEVGPGTFRPLSAETLAEHVMHCERFSVSQRALESIQAVRARGGRIVAVGTTSCRTLESLPQPLPSEDVVAETDLLIAPGHEFRYVDALLTNFHLPRSTLLALVAAALGLERTMDVYKEAISHGYRFYSYGDAMLIL